jgi:hypothetical protein
MDYIGWMFDRDEREALNSRAHSQLPAIIPPARPPAVLSHKRLLLLRHWHLIAVAAFASGAGVVMALVWPLFSNRPAVTVQPARAAVSHVVQSATPPLAATTRMTTATAPIAAGLNAAEPVQDVVRPERPAELGQDVVHPERPADLGRDAVRPERAKSVMAPDRQARLLRRGSDFLRDGNVVAARLVLQLAADAGNAQAALLLGATYDPLMLADLGVRGLQADREAARTWYRRAGEYGASEAAGRIERLAQVVK